MIASVFVRGLIGFLRENRNMHKKLFGGVFAYIINASTTGIHKLAEEKIQRSSRDGTADALVKQKTRGQERRACKKPRDVVRL